MACRNVAPALSFGLTVVLLFSAAAVGLWTEPAGRQQMPPAVASPLLDLTSFLPGADEAPGWTPKGDPQVYKGEDLFTYIDGGADIYNEYGFRQVIVQDYENAPKKSLTLEVFEMADAPAAFGIFTFKSSSGGMEIFFGQGGRLEDYYLNFWKGPVLVTVTGFDESPASLEGVRRVAEATDHRIRVRGEKPALAAALPSEWAARGVLKYIRGPLGLRNLHPVFARPAIRFNEGIAGWPEDGVLVVVLRGDSPSGAKTVFSDAQNVFSSNPPFAGYRTEEDRFDARDSKGHFIQGRLLDGGLALLVSKGPLVEPERIWGRLRDAFATEAK
jgi:hypothetical protein